MKPEPSTVTEILLESADSSETLEKVIPLVYDELRRLAAHFLRHERSDHTLKTTELVHEAYLRLFGWEKVSYSNRRHFFAAASVAMRRVLVEYARRRGAGTRIPPEAQLPVELVGDIAIASERGVLALDGALEDLAQLHPRQAKLVELRIFAGLTETQTADVLGVSRATVVRDMRAAKLWLRREMRR